MTDNPQCDVKRLLDMYQSADTADKQINTLSAMQDAVLETINELNNMLEKTKDPNIDEVWVSGCTHPLVSEKLPDSHYGTYRQKDSLNLGSNDSMGRYEYLDCEISTNVCYADVTVSQIDSHSGMIEHRFTLDSRMLDAFILMLQRAKFHMEMSNLEWKANGKKRIDEHGQIFD